MTFADPKTYASIAQGDKLVINGLKRALNRGESTIEVRNATKRKTFTANLDLGRRQRDIVVAGGLLNFTRKRQAGA
jgi:aconitate hydratase